MQTLRASRSRTGLISCCISLIALSGSTQAQQIPAESPGAEAAAANITQYVINGACYGTGIFSGSGTLDTMESGLFSTPGGTFDGTGVVNSTSGIFNGTGIAYGNAQFNISDDAPGYIFGAGTATGDGTFGTESGTFTGTGTYSGSNISFADGTGSFSGVDTFFNGTGVISGSTFSVTGTGLYEGSGSIAGAGTMQGTFVYAGEASWSGIGIFSGDGFCEGDNTTFITDSRPAAIAAGFPPSITLDNPSAAAPSPAAAAAASM